MSNEQIEERLSELKKNKIEEDLVGKVVGIIGGIGILISLVVCSIISLY